MAKSQKEKGKKEKHEGPKTSWEDVIREAVINDDEWKCHVVLLAEGDIRFTEYLTTFHEAAKKGLRRSIKSISYKEEIKNTKIQNIRHGGEAAKQKKQNPKVAQEQGSAKFFGEAQQALQDALKEVKQNPYLVPGDLLALFVKFLILMVRESDIELRAMQQELKQELEMENMMMLSTGGDKGKKGGKTGGSEKSKGSSKKGKEAKSPENMHINKLHKRGEEWRDKEFIEDQPPDGPQMYIALLGFLHTELPRHLHELGVPLTAIIKVTDKEQRKQTRESRPSQHTGEEFKDITSIFMPINGASTGTISICDWKDPEESMPCSTDMVPAPTQSESENSDIIAFWEGLKLVEEEDPFCLKDIATLAFHVPDFLEVFTDDPDKEKVQKKPKKDAKKAKQKDANKAEKEEAVYELVSKILFCVESISHQHQDFLEQTETISLNCTPLLQEVTEEESLQLYNKMISLVPPECTTVPVILHCLLEQVDALCTSSDAFKMSVSNEKQKSQSEKREPLKSEAEAVISRTSLNLKFASESSKRTLKSISSTQKMTETSTVSSEKNNIHKSKREYEASSTYVEKCFTKPSFQQSEVQGTEYKGEYYELKPEESKTRVTGSSQYHRPSSRNEYLLQEPKVILLGDTADLITFHLEMPEMDVWSIVIQMLEKHPLALLWGKYPPLQPMQYIKYNYDFNRLWHVMGGSTKCSRYLLRHFLALVTFEQLRNKKNQGNVESLKPQEKLSGKSRSERNVNVDAPNADVTTELRSKNGNQLCKNVSIIKQEDTCASVHKLQLPFPQLCDVHLTPLHLEGIHGTAALNRSSLPDVETEREKSENLTGATNERACSLSDLSEMLECPELMELMESHKYSSELQEQDYYCITSTYRNLQQLSKPIMLQTLQKYMVTFKSLKHKFCPLLDSLLLFFHHGDKWGIWKEKWCAAIESPVALRDFYDYILYNKAKEASQKTLTQRDPLKVTSKEDLKVSIKESQGQPRFTDEDFILENSIKYKVNLEKKAEQEQQVSSENKSKDNKGKKSKKDTKEAEKDEKQKNKTDVKDEGGSKYEGGKNNSDKIGAKKLRDNIKDTLQVVKEPSSQEASSKQNFMKNEFQHDIYDLGPLRVQYSGSSAVYLCSDQCNIRVDITQWLYGTAQIYSQFYKHGHILSLYTYFKSSIGPFVKEPLMFSFTTANGVFLTFTKSSYKPYLKKTSTISSVSVQESAVPEKLNAKAVKTKTKASPKTVDKKNAKQNKDINKAEKVPSLDDKDSSDTVEDIPYYNLKITWPNSLLVETVIKVQNDGEQSEKLCTIVPVGIDQLYIRQRYYSKGPECSSLLYENYRCVLCNGNVLKFMTDDTLEVLTAYGTIYYINTLLKPESSTSLSSKDTGSSKSVGKDDPAIKTAAEQKGRSEQKQQKASNIFSVHDISEAERMTQSNPEVLLWQIKEYDVLNPDGVLFTINNDTGTTNIIERMLCDINHDYRTGEILTLRGDGTSMLLLPGGNLVTTYPDNTTVCTVLHESLFEWTPEETQELLAAEREIKLKMYQIMAEDGEISFSSYEALKQINEENNHTPEESTGESSSSDAYLEQDACPILEEFVMVNTTILVEHPNYATVTYEELEKDVTVSNPHGLEVKILKQDMYFVTLDSTTSAIIKPDSIQYQASDSNSNMTSLTEVNLAILKEERDSIPEDKENSVSNEEKDTVKGEKNSLTKEEKNPFLEKEENTVLDAGKSPSVLSSTKDAKGNVILVYCNGAVERQQVLKMPNKDSFALQQPENSLMHGRCVVLCRDLSGFEMISDKEVSAQLDMFKEVDDVCVDKDPVIGSPNLYSYTIIAPVYNTASQEWLMPISELIKNVKKKDLIPSTYGPPKSWIHPFNLSEQKLRKLEEHFGTGDVEKHRKPQAVTLQVCQEMFPKGINIADDIQEGLSRYKSMAQDMYASYLSHEYAPDEEEEEIIQNIGDIADTPENIIRKYRIAMLEKTMLKQEAEHEYHKRTRHPTVCMRKLIEEAEEAEYYKDLIRTYPKHVPSYFDSLPGMCFKMVLQSANRALHTVEEYLEEDLPQFCRKLIPLRSAVSSSEGRHSECLGTSMEKALKKLAAKTTTSEVAWRMVLQSIAEETTLEPTIAALEKAAKEN